MPGTSRHLMEQGRVISALGRLAFSAAKQRIGGKHQAMTIPGPVFQEQVNPPSARLVEDYLRAVGGNPRHYRDTIPAHLFPQWSFPLAARALEGIHYPIEKVLNGGCCIHINGPLPAGEPLELSGQLESVDETDKRVVLRTRITTSTALCRDAIVTILESYIPLQAKQKSPKNSVRRARECVPAEAKEIASWRLGPRDARSFALLTGDINPVHWVPAYARAMGFRGTILHGFSTMAHAIEGLNRSHFSADVTRLTSFRAKFTRPLVLPATVGLYLDGNGGVFVGDSPGGPAYMVGDYTTCPSHARETHT